MKMTQYFDQKHISFQLFNKMYFKIVHNLKINYKLSFINILNSVKINSFKIKHQINSLIYELNLLKNIQIYSVILIVHLKSATKNSYK